MWDNYKYYLIALNVIHFVYPILITYLVTTSQGDLYKNRVEALAITSIPTLLELIELWSNWRFYFKNMANWLDFVGLISIYIFFSLESQNRDMVFLILIGLFCNYYKGIASLSIIHNKFMVSIKLIKNSIFNIIPFLGVVIAQILLFTFLDSVKMQNEMQLEAINTGKDGEINGLSVFLENLFYNVMLIIGGPKRKNPHDDLLGWAVFIVFAVLMNIINMKLLIAVLGETFAKH